MIELFREFFWLIFPILGMGIAFMAVAGEFGRQKKALEVLRTYAEKGVEPPANVLAVLSRASSENKKNPKASFAFFTIMALGFIFVAGWFNGTGGSWPFVLRLRHRVVRHGRTGSVQSRAGNEQEQLCEW